MQIFTKPSLIILLISYFYVFQSYSQSIPVKTANEYVKPYSAPLQIGSNMGVFGNGWTDEKLVSVMEKAGGGSVRPTLPEHFVEKWGYGIRLNAFKYYVNDLGMQEITCFIEGPSDAHRDKTVYTGTESSKLFANLYEPIWNGDGTVNANNYYAIYVYKLIQTYGDYIRFWEVLNEPDLGNANRSEWLTRAPLPSESNNTKAPFYHYIRMLRITWEVVKKYSPEDYVTTGGIGYTQYLDALLRYTDNPNGGAVTSQYPNKGGAYFDVVSYHFYPQHVLKYWDGVMKYTRTSDHAANKVVEHKKAMEATLTKYGYNGSTYPKKHFIITETGVTRRTSDDHISSDEMQRNYAIKVMIQSHKNDIKQLYFFTIGESEDCPPPGSTIPTSHRYGNMGFYENLRRDALGSEKYTDLGKATKTTNQLLEGFTYDAARTAALNLPSQAEGAAFRKGTEYIYVLWAKALVDTKESASASYSFPSALNISGVERFEWNHAITNSSTKQAPQDITLTGSPAFFKVTSTTTVAGQTQTINFPSIPSKTYGDADFTISATASSGLPVAFRVTSGPAKITGNTITITGAGTVSVEATQSGNSTYEAATPVTQSFTVNKASQTIAFAALLDKVYGDADFNVNATASSNLAVSFRIASGPAKITGNTVTLTGEGTVVVEATQGGNTNYNAATAVKQSFSVSAAPSAPTEPATCSATGSILREQWDNVSGSSVSVIPVSTAPSSTSQLNLFEAPTSVGSNYGARVRGYICPPATGDYTFFIAGDDNAELWLSTDDSPANKRKIASVDGWTYARQWNKYATQKSVAIRLEAGKRYYIEALHKEASGGDNLAVAWQMPDGKMEAPIAGSRLSPAEAAEQAPAPSEPGTCSATGTILREQWDNVSGTSVSLIPLNTAPSSTSQLNLFEAPTSAGTNYGARVRGYICPPATGDYIFFIAGDDNAELWLSTDDSPANRKKIASVTGWTYAREWNKYATQKSVAIRLEAGKRYYIEALHKEGGQGDNLAVAWQMPDGKMEAPIAGSRLSPYTATGEQAPAPSEPTPTEPAPTSCSATGTIFREQWDNVSGSQVSLIPLNTAPSSSRQLSSFETTNGQGYNYGARVRGYICPPATGDYTLYIAGDDNAELWLSTDDSPANRKKIAYVTGWTYAREWNKYATQKSVAIRLEAGKRYYIEALHKQGGQGDNMAVAWKLPDGNMEAPIAGNRLSPYTATSSGLVSASDLEVTNQLLDEAELTAYPNPFTTDATVQFTLTASEEVSLVLYDIQGRLVRRLYEGTAEANAPRSFELTAEGLTRGVYIIRLMTGSKVLTQKIVLEK